MEVRIRRASEASSRHLTTTSLDKLDQVIPTLNRWGIKGPGVPDDADLVGQVWIDGQYDGRAFFEVIIIDDEA
jgi:hypothetical protein